MSHQQEVDIEAVQRMAQSMPQWRQAALTIEPLQGGITNRNFVITALGTRHVLRLPGERTELLGIDRANEAQAAWRAAALGIGPPVLGELPGAHTLITELIPGSHLQGDAFVQRLPEVVDLLRRWHTGAPLPGIFPIHRIVERHVRDAAANGVSPPAQWPLLHRASLRIEAALAKASRPLVPCHNDLLGANLLFDQSRVWLLDYEYAGMNDAFFDLANLSVNAEFDAGTDERMLQRYFGVAHKTAWARLQLMKVMSEMREGMWGLVQQAISTLDTDFKAYCGERLANCERLIGAPAFEAWLEQVASGSG